MVTLTYINFKNLKSIGSERYTRQDVQKEIKMPCMHFLCWGVTQSPLRTKMKGPDQRFIVQVMSHCHVAFVIHKLVANEYCTICKTK